jgi:hypothetical protein
MDAAAQARATALALKFIDTATRPADLVGIMERDGSRFRVIQDFTGDRDLLAGAIQRLSDDSGTPPAAGSQLEALRSVTEVVRWLAGTKEMVSFAQGMPLAGVGADQVRPFVDAAVHANVAFFPIDVGGLAAYPSYVIGAGDTLSISVPSERRFDGAYTVGADGTISIPLAGEIKAAGLTAAQLQQAIDKALLRYLKTPSSHVNVVTVRSKPAGN